MSDHQWPAELDSEAVCENCGLPYGQWIDPDTLWCTA